MALPGCPLGQAIREQIVDALELVRLLDGLHLEAQVLALDTAGEEPQFPAGLMA